MPIQNLNTADARIGKQKGEMIAHSEPVQVLGITGQEKQMDRNMGSTIVYRRQLPYGATDAAVSGGADPTDRWSVTASAHLTQEGVTPAADTLAFHDVTLEIQQYMCLYGFTDKTYDLYEDDIPAEMKIAVGERMGLVKEMVRYGALKACTNKFYSGGTTRATVDQAITLSFLRNITKSLKGNHAKMVTRIIDGGAKEGTSPVEAAYLVFAHTDCEPDIRDLPKFIPVAEYGSRTVVHENEIGSCENFRFITSPHLSPVADSGAAVGTTGLVSTSLSQVDVYPIVVTGMDAWCSLGVKNSKAMDIIWLPPGQKDKSDPGGQRGYAGAKFYFQAGVLNNGWMAIGEVGVTTQG